MEVCYPPAIIRSVPASSGTSASSVQAPNAAAQSSGVARACLPQVTAPVSIIRYIRFAAGRRLSAGLEALQAVAMLLRITSFGSAPRPNKRYMDSPHKQ
jgi:hypothetical protein